MPSHSVQGRYVGSSPLCAGPETSKGQIAPLVLFGVLIASAMLVLMYNTGNKITEKSRLANAADAAAYSGAVWTARHLNFMAYTNRAMVANHVGVGHVVSYVSWMRYIDETISHIEDFARFIPYAGQYVEIVREIASEARSLAEESAEFAIPTIDAWNASYRTAQREAQASLAVRQLTELMQRTARTYDAEIRINDSGELASLPAPLRAALDSRLLSQTYSMASFVERDYAGEDDGQIEELIDRSLRAHPDTARWIAGERGWRFNALTHQFRKQGATTHFQSRDSADWWASDRLQTRRRRLFGWSRWRNVRAAESASAGEFDGDYAGVPAYYDLGGRPGVRGLEIVAIATRRQGTTPQRRFRDLGGSRSATDPGSIIAALAVARIEFKRPTGNAVASLGRASEYANLFNPFWEARLAETGWGMGS